MKVIRYFALPLALLASLNAQAQQPIKVGMVTTLSAGSAGFGVNIHDGFALALKHFENHGDVYASACKMK